MAISTKTRIPDITSGKLEETPSSAPFIQIISPFWTN